MVVSLVLGVGVEVAAGDVSLVDVVRVLLVIDKVSTGMKGDEVELVEVGSLIDDVSAVLVHC